MLIGRIPVLPQQIYPKLKFVSKMLIFGATDSAWNGTFMMSPPLIITLKNIFTSWMVLLL
jgi:hypothetical protein